MSSRSGSSKKQRRGREPARGLFGCEAFLRKFLAVDVPAVEDREVISQALKRLGERTRQIIEFVFFYDLSQKETAYVLGLSEMGVSRAVHSALKKLREIMAQEAKQ